VKKKKYLKMKFIMMILAVLEKQLVQIKEMVELTLRHPQLCNTIDVKPSHDIFFYMDHQAQV